MNKGLTLVEMLITLVILGFVGAGLIAVFSGHILITEPLQAQVDMIHDTRAGYDILARELRHCCAIEHGTSDSLAFRAVVGGVSQRYKYAVRGRALRREAGNGGMQEVIANASLLRFRYFMIDGTEITPPIRNANDQLVSRIQVRLRTTLPDRSDSLELSGYIAPRNMR